jgi:hypothetical protein
MIKNIKIYNILHIIEISKSMKYNKCIHKNNYDNVHLSVSYDFSKFDGSKKYQGVTFLVVSPKGGLALL